MDTNDTIEDQMEMTEVGVQKQPHNTVDCDDLTHIIEDDTCEHPTGITTSQNGLRTDKPGRNWDLVYALDDVPPWYTTLLLGLQVSLKGSGVIVDNYN